MLFRWNAAGQGFIDDKAHHDLRAAGQDGGLVRVDPEVVEPHWNDAHAAGPVLVASIHRHLHVNVGFLPGLVLGWVHQVFGCARPVKQGDFSVLFAVADDSDKWRLAAGAGRCRRKR